MLPPLWDSWLETELCSDSSSEQFAASVSTEDVVDDLFQNLCDFRDGCWLGAGVSGCRGSEHINPRRRGEKS